VILCVELCYQTSPSFVYPDIDSPTPTYLFKVRMSVEHTELEKSVEEVVKKFMADKGMSEGIQASSTRGLQASPLNVLHSGRAKPTTEKRSKQHDDLANTK
jgi:hypothetical protein